MSGWIPAFSPDNHIITIAATGDMKYHVRDLLFISWDLQTGGISSIGRENPGDVYSGRASIAYSVDGKMVGIHYYHESGPYASVYDAASGALKCSPSLKVGQPRFDNI